VVEEEVDLGQVVEEEQEDIEKLKVLQHLILQVL
tara:strand:+ start:174 stop:275 length:102 start_codon:yes stop_codon:yes gene_type:complete